MNGCRKTAIAGRKGFGEKIFANSVFGGEILDTSVLCTVKSEYTP